MALEDPYPDDKWTASRLIDELFLELDSVEETDQKYGIIKRKYEEHAKYLLYRIPVYDSIPTFVVHLKDLSDRTKEELRSLDEELLDEVLRGVIGRIFENINERYFRLSVRRFLKWELRE